MLQGTAIILGIQLSHIQSAREKAEQEHRHRQLSVAQLLCRQAFQTGTASRSIHDGGGSAASGVSVYVDTGQTRTDQGVDIDEIETSHRTLLTVTYPGDAVSDNSKQVQLISV